MKTAIVGTGVSGLVSAYHLHRAGHEVRVFEAAERVGGHVNTVNVEIDGQVVAIDTGFIVHNPRNYPRLCALFEELDVPTQESEMTFSVTCAATGWVWGGGGIGAAFAQPRRMADLRFLRMLVGISSFNRSAREALADDSLEPTTTLRQFISDEGVNDDVVERYIRPLGASIWSADPATFDAMPAKMLFSFLENHGLLQLRDRPQWRTVTGGARVYVEKLTAPFADRISTSTPVLGIARHPIGVTISTPETVEHFDQVVVATHSDQALGLLDDPTDAEQEILGALRYKENTAVLHTDRSMLPSAERAWSAWNNYRPAEPTGEVAVTYLMNLLQRLPVETPVCVTLGRTDDIEPSTILGTYVYQHPIFDVAAATAQTRRGEINGVANTYYVGAYWYHGFHEDGVRSADDVVAELSSVGADA